MSTFLVILCGFFLLHSLALHSSLAVPMHSQCFPIEQAKPLCDVKLKMQSIRCNLFWALWWLMLWTSESYIFPQGFFIIISCSKYRLVRNVLAICFQWSPKREREGENGVQSEDTCNCGNWTKSRLNVGQCIVRGHARLHIFSFSPSASTLLFLPVIFFPRLSLLLSQIRSRPLAHFFGCNYNWTELSSNRKLDQVVHIPQMNKLQFFLGRNSAPS